MFSLYWIHVAHWLKGLLWHEVFVGARFFTPTPWSVGCVQNRLLGLPLPRRAHHHHHRRHRHPSTYSFRAFLFGILGFPKASGWWTCASRHLLVPGIAVDHGDNALITDIIEPLTNEIYQNMGVCWVMVLGNIKELVWRNSYTTVNKLIWLAKSVLSYWTKPLILTKWNTSRGRSGQLVNIC